MSYINNFANSYEGATPQDFQLQQTIESLVKQVFEQDSTLDVTSLDYEILRESDPDQLTYLIDTEISNYCEGFKRDVLDEITQTKKEQKSSKNSYKIVNKIQDKEAEFPSIAGDLQIIIKKFLEHNPSSSISDKFDILYQLRDTFKQVVYNDQTIENFLERFDRSQNPQYNENQFSVREKKEKTKIKKPQPEKAKPQNIEKKKDRPLDEVQKFEHYLGELFLEENKIEPYLPEEWVKSLKPKRK
ncbi:hypothetical protein pb186bvf_000699 [Paramecium bursaria]